VPGTGSSNGSRTMQRQVRHERARVHFTSQYVFL
jgi:hypothetical protein